MTADRQRPEGYVVHQGDDRTSSVLLSRRELMALLAVRAGRVRWRWRRTRTPYYADARLELEAEDFGIGYGTLANLRRRWHRGAFVDLIADHAGDECVAELAPMGTEVLEAVLALEGMEATA